MLVALGQAKPSNSLLWPIPPRDLLLASSQQSNELKDALESENEKTKLMEESMAKLDIEMKRSDDLLDQMMPKSVAQKIKVV